MTDEEDFGNSHTIPTVIALVLSIHYYYYRLAEAVASVAIALVPTLVAAVVAADPVPIEVVGTAPTVEVVGVAIPVPGEFAVAEAAPIAAVPIVEVVGTAASTHFVVVKPVAVQQRHVLRALYDRCEYAAKGIGPPAPPQPR